MCIMLIINTRIYVYLQMLDVNIYLPIHDILMRNFKQCLRNLANCVDNTAHSRTI